MKYYVDGSGWNGKKSEYCVTDETEIISRLTLEEEFTNNQMEYLALIHALEKAKDGNIILSDSQLVVNQITKGWKINFEYLRNLNFQAKEILKNKNVIIQWIPREENRAGWILENK